MSDTPDRGITVTEIAPMGEPIDVSPETSVAFIGRTLRGPLNTPVAVGSFAEFRKRFGDSWSRSSLGPAVEQFFEHGGRRLFVVRVANNARGAVICLPAAGSALVLRAVEPGSSEHIRASVDYDGINGDTSFNLTLQRIDPATGLVSDQEMYRRLSYREQDERFVVDSLLHSRMVRVEHPHPAQRPDVTPASNAGYGVGYIDPVQAGTDGNELTDYDLIGSRADGTGLFALERLEQALERLDLIYMPPPGKGRDVGPAAILAAELFCRAHRTMLVIDPPSTWHTAADVVARLRRSGFQSDNLITYFPRMRLRGSADRSPRAAGGAFVGLLCKNDRLHGRWRDLDEESPGFKRRLRPVIDLDDAESRRLAGLGVNVVRVAAAGMARLSGSVTLGYGNGMDTDVARLAARRLCLGIVASIDRATRWAIFERLDERLVQGLKAQLEAYLAGLAERGAFADGRFDIRCDVRPTPGEVNAANEVTLLLTFRPVGCGKPMSVTVHQSISGCRVSRTAFAPAGGTAPEGMPA